MPDKQRQFFDNLQKNLEGGAVQPEELIRVAKIIIEVVNGIVSDLKSDVENVKSTHSAFTGGLSNTNESLKDLLSRLYETNNRLPSISKKEGDRARTEANTFTESQVSALRSALSKELGELRSFIGNATDTTSISDRITTLEEKVETPELIRDKLETLEGEDRLDASAIKNLEDYVKEKADMRIIASNKPLSSLIDVNVTGLANGNTLVWNGTQWVPGSGGGGGGSGTVTSVSVVSANGFAGSVANATTTPAITLSTSITGLLKGNGTAISAASAGTDYQAPISLTTTGTSGAATFIGNTLNIPQYAGTTYTGTTNRISVTGSVIDIASAYVGQSSITTLGTITTGTWNGSTITYPYLGSGGTGAGTKYLADDGTWKTYAAGGGSVISVASADGSITVTNPTSTVDLAVVKAPKLTTPRTIGTATGDVTSAGSAFDGTANNTNAYTLATVNSNVGTFGSSTSIPTFTVNAKGLITAASGNAVIAPAGTLSGTTLNSTVVTSSLTSVGTLGSLSVTGNITNAALTASKVVFTDASKNLTSTGIGTSSQFIKGDGSLDSNTYITGNQTITLSGHVTGSGTTAITTSSASKFILQGTTDSTVSAAQFLGALGTGIVKNTTTTGVLSIAVAADFPTLNQSTTGSAATLTTARTIGIATGDVTSAGSTFNGSADNTNAYTLATVNSNVGSFTNANITVNGKGLITAASSGIAPPTVKAINQTTHGFAVGNIIRLSAASTYTKAKGDTAANAEVIGIVSTVVDANNFVLTTEGYVSGLSGLTANTTYFLDTATAGAMTATEPSTAGLVRVPIFVSDTNTSGYFHKYEGQVLTGAGAAGLNLPISTKTTTYTASASDYSLLGNATSTSFIITLPPASTSTGVVLQFKKIDSSANTVTVKGNASELIYGASGAGSNTNVLSSQGTAITVQCDGTSWYTF